LGLSRINNKTTQQWQIRRFGNSDWSTPLTGVSKFTKSAKIPKFSEKFAKSTFFGRFDWLRFPDQSNLADFGTKNGD
jgi:hypothetical protein